MSAGAVCTVCREMYSTGVCTCVVVAVYRVLGGRSLVVALGTCSTACICFINVSNPVYVYCSCLCVVSVCCVVLCVQCGCRVRRIV